VPDQGAILPNLLICGGNRAFALAASVARSDGQNPGFLAQVRRLPGGVGGTHR
jgi:hypothetical protein